jgi:hypothetical protein
MQDRINAQGTKPILPLVDEIERILGPFYLPVHPSNAVSALDSSEDWEGAYTSDYAVPEDLKARAQMSQEFIKSRAPVSFTHGVVKRASIEPASAVEYSKGKIEALTEALAFTHSRSKLSQT